MAGQNSIKSYSELISAELILKKKMCLSSFAIYFCDPISLNLFCVSFFPNLIFRTCSKPISLVPADPTTYLISFNQAFIEIFGSFPPQKEVLQLLLRKSFARSRSHTPSLSKVSYGDDSDDIGRIT